jgi:3-hydroxyisobutyrate dehydrogenase-like beta-hydroxyacid dehydrogenase
MQHLIPASLNPVPYSRPASPRPQLQIGFVGLGNMGYLMARNLANHNAQMQGSPPLLVWNRSSEKAANLVSEVGPGKARVAKDLEEVLQLCDIIITSLANDHVVKSIYQQYAKILTVR